MTESTINDVLELVRRRNATEPEFLQVVTEVLEAIEPCIQRHKKYRDGNVLERMVEPERILIFRVPWVNDQGRVKVNRGYRVQFNSALGPVQRRLALSSHRQFEHPEVSGL